MEGLIRYEDHLFRRIYSILKKKRTLFVINDVEIMRRKNKRYVSGNRQVQYLLRKKKLKEVRKEFGHLVEHKRQQIAAMKLSCH